MAELSESKSLSGTACGAIIQGMDSKQNNQINLPCQPVIVYGSTQTACELLLELQKKNTNPLFLCTNEVISGKNEIISGYWDCATNVQELNALRLKLEEAKVKKIIDNKLQSIEYRETDQLFYIKTSSGEFLCMCFVICAQSDIEKYRQYVYKHRGLFTCGHSKKIHDTVEDVEFHMNLTTELLRAKVVETTTPAKNPPISPSMQEPLVKLMPRKVFCCC